LIVVWNINGIIKKEFSGGHIVKISKIAAGGQHPSKWSVCVCLDLHCWGRPLGA